MLTGRVVSLGNEQAWGTEGNKIEGMPIQECIIKLAVFERGPMVLSHSRIFYRMVKNEPDSCLLKEWKEEPFINWLSTPITWVLPGGILTPLHFWVSCTWLPRELLHASQAEASEICWDRGKGYSTNLNWCPFVMKGDETCREETGSIHWQLIELQVGIFLCCLQFLI